MASWRTIGGPGHPTAMRQIATFLMLTWAAIASHAADPAAPAPASASASAACQRALAGLELEEAKAASALRDAASAAQVGNSTSLAQARRAAAMACLGPGAGASVPPQRRAEPPISVPGIRIGPPAGPPAAAARIGGATAAPPVTPPPPPPPPPPQPRLPQVLTSCDAAGCWTSDGTRLQRVGPVLTGPRGACSVAGTAVSCP